MKGLNPKQGAAGMSALPLCDWVDAKALAASTAEAFTVPAGAHFVRLSGTVDFYVNDRATAIVPVDTADGTAAELIPAGGNGRLYAVEPGDVLSVIAGATAVVTAAYYGAA